MKRFLATLIILLSITLPASAIEEVSNSINETDISDSARDFAPIQLDVEKNDIEITKSKELATLEEKIDEKIEKFYDPKYRTIQLNGEIIKSMNFQAVYQGQFAFLKPTHSTDSTFEYDNNYLNLATYIDFADEKTEFTGIINPFRRVKNYNYLNAIVSDVNIRHHFNEHNNILIGQSRIPIGYEGRRSAYDLPFASRSQIARQYANVRTYGVRNQGNYEFFNYDIAVTDSTRYLQRVMQGAEVSGIVEFKPLARVSDKYGNLTLGASTDMGKKEHVLGYTVTGGYVAYKYKKLGADFEYLKAHGSNGMQASSKFSEGFYTTLYYNLTKKVQLLGRYDFFNADKHADGQKSQEYCAGINYFAKDNLFKIQLNYVYKQRENGQNSNQYIIVTQIAI